ncbi:MAG TPA: Rieske 2Fe-2S domain-containing protein [Vicinamibacteria bacterium]|nr:Rieske 2Fe-2S domain-containing protein [Vicinamibacteria bacterium]
MLWREEFSVHAADERYVTRRQFGKFLVLTSLGMFVGNVWILARSLWRGDERMPLKKIANVADVPVGGVTVFHYPGPHDPCLLMRTAADTFVAYSQKCTHLSCAVFPSADGRKLECPCHEGYFSVADGRVLQGPPPRPLPRVVLDRFAGGLWAVGVDLGAREA